MSQTENPLFENDSFIIEHCRSCPLPGYLIVSLKRPVRSFGELGAQLAAELGTILAAATAAVEKVVRPENVYVARFGEEAREIHFHIFPRTKDVAEAYRRAHDASETALSGPLVFDWTRKHYSHKAGATEIRAELARELAALIPAGPSTK